MYQPSALNPRAAGTPARVASTINPRIGIVGGGQLAKMTALAGLELGCDVLVLERNTHSPAATLASHSIVGDWDNPESLVALASQVDVVTLENEFVDARALAALEDTGHLLYPTARSIALVQDKFIQKQSLSTAGLPVARFRAVDTPADLIAAGADFGWPLVLKARRNGYDGKGNATLAGAADIETAWSKLDGGKRALYVEACCPFVMELATIITSGRDGEVAAYPIVESEQRDHICHVVRAPAALPAETIAQATDIARRAVAAVGAVGSFGVEMFLTAERQVLINELAPRVHNSGHYTIEACECSQFENHVRAVLGWPLGSTRMVTPAAVMVNLLGQGRGPGRPAGMDAALNVPGAHVHVYGKAMSSAGRKMGHVTAVGESVAEAESRAQQSARAIRFGSPS